MEIDDTRERALAMFSDRAEAEARIALGYILVSPGSVYYISDPPRLGHDHGDEDDGEARTIAALLRTLASRRSLPW